MANPKELTSLDGTEKKVLRFLATTLENGRSTLEATELSDFLGGLEAEHRLVSIVARFESLGFLSECVPRTAPALKKAATRDNPETHSLIMHQRAQYVGWKISGSVLDTDSPMAPALDDDDEAKQATPNKPISKEVKRVEWLAKAMLLVQEHPEYSDAEVARQVGKHPSTLSRNKTYQQAAAMARSSKKDRHRGFIEMDEDSGQRRGVVAYSDDPAERDLDE